MSEPLPPATGSPGPEPSDEALLARVASGDVSAVAVLYDRYQGIMYGLATRITGDPGLAEDAVQNAFVGIWRNASRFVAGRASARTWLLAITHHRAVDAVRRRRPTAQLPDPGLPPPAALVLPDIWEEVRGRLDLAAVGEALGRIPPPQREAIELAYFGGLTQQEIARRTASPLGTVKSRVRLGLQALRAELEAASKGGGEVPGPLARAPHDLPASSTVTAVTTAAEGRP